MTRFHCSTPRKRADHNLAPAAKLTAQDWLLPGCVGAREGLPRRDDGDRVLTLARAALAVRRVAVEG